ncbi:prepilin-type N-terminal cleavage/methylation domain-containing protein [candidate division WWE3 bacterium]|nr:prepilin-type N-terminal cleavage/methylation domain-containing protein [candidate division WWE3 bacterium]
MNTRLNLNTSFKKTSFNHGFTLVELLVVIVILGILATLTLSVLNPSYFFGRGRDTRRQSDLQSVRGALEQYYLDNGRVYPNVAYSSLQTPLSPYLDSFPTDPGSTAYTYSVSANQKCFQLSATMERSTPSTFRVCGGSLACQNANSFCP